MAERVVGALIGVVFGVVLSWTALIDPDTIRFGLLFEDLYPILVFAAAVTTAFVARRSCAASIRVRSSTASVSSG